jgi:predicted nicotinamide N-methyase
MVKKRASEQSKKKASAKIIEHKDDNNKPRNHLILDAAKPFFFDYTQFGSKVRMTIHQTPSAETWPGGALWDLGVILAKLLVSWTRGATYPQATPLPNALSVYSTSTWKDTTVLELGCGTGLTGLVAASLGAKVTILTDLQVVVEQVTQRNVDENTQSGPTKLCGYRTTRAGGKVVAMPLCWGNTDEEEATQRKLQELVKPKTTFKDNAEQPKIYPDWILIGDVAYQQTPGAPSHFDVLLSTLLKFVGPETKVLFGTRMRMPASLDLLDMFRSHLHESACVESHELDPGLAEIGCKHNMTIHILEQRK